MKTLIINPPSFTPFDYIREGRCEQRLSSFQYMMPPISLPSIAAVLIKHRYDVKIIDCIAHKLDFDSLRKKIVDINPGFIILTVSTATFYGDMQTAERMKKDCKAHIAVIGTHVTALAAEVLSAYKVDSVVRGEPEITCLELADLLKNKRNEDLHNVKGLSFLCNGEIVHNDDRPFVDNLDELPFPSRELLDNKRYTLPVINKPYTLLISSRGCPHDCIYCTAHQYYGKKPRLRSAESIACEIKEIIEKFDIHYITMWADTFTFNRNHVLNVCKLIRSLKINVKWMCNSRVDTVDPELLRNMKSAGCIGISYGVESGVQEILNNSNKNVFLEQIQDAFKWTHAAGIESLAHTIFGLPGETKKTIAKTLQFVKNLNPDYAQFYCAIPFPGTKFYEMAQKNGWLITNDWSRFELNQAIINTSGLPLNDLKKGKEMAYRAFYCRHSYFLKRLSKIKSLDDFMLTLKQGIKFFKDWVLKT